MPLKLNFSSNYEFNIKNGIFSAFSNLKYLESMFELFADDTEISFTR